MVKCNIIKLSIILITFAMLGSIALTINPAQIGYAQGSIGDILRNITDGDGNMTHGNIDIDTLTKNITERHPILAQTTSDEYQYLTTKIKDMDSKEAAKTIIALNMLRLLQQYKQLDVE